MPPNDPATDSPTAFDVDVVEVEPTTVVGIQRHYDGDDSIFQPLWQEFGRRWSEFDQLATEDAGYGVATDVEMEPMAFDYTVGVPTDDAGTAPDDFVTVEIPGGSYARFETTLDEFDADHERLTNEWLPSSGYRRRPGPEFERYGPEFDPEDRTSTYEYYVPVSGAD